MISSRQLLALTTSHIDRPASSASHGLWKDRLLLLLCCLIWYLPGVVSLPPLDRDESRFAQASKQMLESEDFIDIRFQDQSRYKKPVAVYWLQAAAAAAWGTHPYAEISVYRLPSLLAAVAAVLLTHALGWRLFDRSTALFAGAFLGGSLLLTGEAQQAKTDAVLLASLCVAQLALAQRYLGHRQGKETRSSASPAYLPWLFWVALAVSILVKGPIGILVIGLTAVSLAIADRRCSWLLALRPLLGVGIIVALILPWFAAVMLVSDGAFLHDALSQDILPKLLGGHEGHGAPPGAYLLMLPLTFWPASLLLWPLLVGAWWGRTEPRIRFLLAWILPSWVLLEVVPTKLPHYPLPTYPALALLAAAVVTGAIRSPTLPIRGKLRRLISGLIWAWGGLSILLGLGIAGLALGFGGGHAPLVLGGMVLLGIAAVVATRRMLHQGCRDVGVAVIACALILHPTLFGLCLPHLDHVWVSRRLAAVVAGIGAGRPLVTTGYAEPSLVFLLGTQVRILSAEDAAVRLQGQPQTLALVEDRVGAGFLASARDKGLSLSRLDRVEGFNYTKGHWVGISIYAVVSPPVSGSQELPRAIKVPDMGRKIPLT